MSLPDLLPIVPFTRPARGEVSVPGSKSLTNRALLLAALCERPVNLTGALFSEDTDVMAKALRKLGFSVAEDAAAARIRVEGAGGKIPVEEARPLCRIGRDRGAFSHRPMRGRSPRHYRLDGVPRFGCAR